MKPINVLSLFDGMSGGQIALERAGISVANYYASEIDKYAIKVTQSHYPNTHQLGTVLYWKNWQLPKIDLVIAGSPCQGFSKAGKGLNFDDPRSKLFFTFMDILNHHKKQNSDLLWMLENVKMKKEWKDYISDLLGVEPVLINSALVSAQNRERLYWANFPIIQPEDKGILLKDIIEPSVEEKYLGGYNPAYKSQSNSLHNLNGKSNNICAGTHGYALGYIPVTPVRVGTASDINGHDYNKRIYSTEGKSLTLNAGSGGNLEPKISTRYVDRTGREIKKYSTKSGTVREAYRIKDNFAIMMNNDEYRKLTPIECERLQTVEDNWTSMVSNTQRYKMLGNGWNIDTIVHIINCSPLGTVSCD